MPVSPRAASYSVDFGAPLRIVPAGFDLALTPRRKRIGAENVRALLVDPPADGRDLHQLRDQVFVILLEDRPADLSELLTENHRHPIERREIGAPRLILPPPLGCNGLLEPLGATLT